MGHNLGFDHDFDHPGRDCTGFMDYGTHPLLWSPCSHLDFDAHYLNTMNSVGAFCTDGKNWYIVLNGIFHSFLSF